MGRIPEGFRTTTEGLISPTDVFVVIFWESDKLVGYTAGGEIYVRDYNPWGKLTEIVRSNGHPGTFAFAPDNWWEVDNEMKYCRADNGQVPGYQLLPVGMALPNSDERRGKVEKVVLYDAKDGGGNGHSS